MLLLHPYLLLLLLFPSSSSSSTSFQGRFTIAAKHHISIAEIYESELVDIEKVRIQTAPTSSNAVTSCGINSCGESWLFIFSTLSSKAIAHYEQAADYYKGEESNR